jgi:hypothetical protein
LSDHLPNVLGLPLARARAQWLAAGFSVECERVAPRKLPAGDSERVIAVRQEGAHAVRLLHANFHTRVDAE